MLKVASLFSQILGEISRIDFQKLVIKHGVERHAKGFRSWTQFVAMLFCHLARADSLREICYGLSCCNGKLVHLGVNRNPNKSTLAYANEHRSSELFKDLFWKPELSIEEPWAKPAPRRAVRGCQKRGSDLSNTEVNR